MSLLNNESSIQRILNGSYTRSQRDYFAKWRSIHFFEWGFYNTHMDSMGNITHDGKIVTPEQLYEIYVSETIKSSISKKSKP